MTIKYHYDIDQGTPEWHELRRGIITASAISSMLTAGGKIADNASSRRACYEIAIERITGFYEETPTTFAMARGHDDEQLAREVYAAHKEPVTECGFITNNRHGVMIGCSPDGLVGDNGGIECKSRLHAIQLEVILANAVPSEYVAQIQTCLLVSERDWWDFLSIPSFGGGKMLVKRVFPDLKYQKLLVEAAKTCEQRVSDIIGAYKKTLDRGDITLLDVPRREPEPADEVKL